MSMIHEKIIAAMQDIEAIGKNKKNEQQGFKFRGIDDVYNTLHPILSKHGLFTVMKVLAERTEERQTRNGSTLLYRILTIEYTVFASDGSSISATVIGEGMDSGDKAASKAMSIAHKYLLLQLFCIPTADIDDPDKESHVVLNLVAECVKTIDTAKNGEALKLAVQYCLDRMSKNNVPEIEVNKFKEHANKLRESFLALKQQPNKQIEEKQNELQQTK